jgi:hypothetical protein
LREGVTQCAAAAAAAGAREPAAKGTFEPGVICSPEVPDHPEIPANLNRPSRVQDTAAVRRHGKVCLPLALDSLQDADDVIGTRT